MVARRKPAKTHTRKIKRTSKRAKKTKGVSYKYVKVKPKRKTTKRKRK